LPPLPISFFRRGQLFHLDGADLVFRDLGHGVVGSVKKKSDLRIPECFGNFPASVCLNHTFSTAGQWVRLFMKKINESEEHKSWPPRLMRTGADAGRPGRGEGPT